MPGPAGVPDRIRFVMRPEKGLYPFKGGTEALQAMGASLGVAWVLQEAKSRVLMYICPLLSTPPPRDSVSSTVK